jgi:hypothetical protein
MWVAVAVALELTLSPSETRRNAIADAVTVDAALTVADTVLTGTAVGVLTDALVVAAADIDLAFVKSGELTVAAVLAVPLAY